MSEENKLGDIFGAFADGAILFPLLVMLSLQGSFSTPVLFASAGLAYWVAGLVFKIPMSVQPLKAIAIAAVAVGASGTEIRLSGFLLGVFCLLMTQFNIERWAAKVPLAVVQCVQLGLGVLLITQGASVVSNASMLVIAAAFILCALICLFSSYPLLGVLAAGGLLGGLAVPSILPAMVIKPAVVAHGDFRALVILSLLLPQMALTLTNSVVATTDVAHRYFGRRASRVIARRLLWSIGLGNIVSAAIGGLPYCHGSGGVTAHYRGGARSALANQIIGTFLLIIAGYAYFSHHTPQIGYPKFLLSSLLMAVGLFHVTLARSRWATTPGKWQLVASGLAALLTHNMLVVLTIAVFSESVIRWLQKSAEQRSGKDAVQTEAV